MTGGVPDAEETAEADLWFLPGPDPEADDLPPGAPPLPRARRAPLFDPAPWRAAQDSLSADLARLTQVFGELDSRLRGAGEGLLQSLALREVADLSWWLGDRLSGERIGLWAALRIGSIEDTEQALARAGWALRRLSGGPPPGAGLAAFLERAGEASDPGSGADLPNGEAGTLADLADLLAQTEGLHPVVQGAFLFHAWRALDPSPSRDIEAAVLAARQAATMTHRPGQGALFLPLAMTGTRALRGQGDPAHKLSAWIAGAEQATLAALLQLDRIVAWEQAAQAAVADLSGRTPARLLAVFAAWPLVTAPLAEAETGASRAAVQRNLDRLVGRGLLREVTGQGRYRVWTAAL